uniref:DNA-directed RNA polymerase I subunit rpa49 n=1 Tax=Leersia perrieri TaxID=77586 RepID=A0A0D9XU59_9ORYZ
MADHHPAASSSPKKKKKKHSKNRESTDPTVDSSLTAASPEKKHSKKRKSTDAIAESSSFAAAAVADTSSPKKKKKKHSKKGESIDATEDAAAISSPKKKKHSEKGETIDYTENASLTAAGAAAAAEFKKVEEVINVTVDASLTAVTEATAAAPIVAYSPTGYDPLAVAAAAARRGKQPPPSRLFRQTKHPSRIELVVGTPGGGPDFVGRSYAGEAALPQHTGYALGVLDKASGTLKVVPIAANKILRLEPQFGVHQPAQSQQSEAVGEAGPSANDADLKVQETTKLFGTLRDKNKDIKWKLLNEQRNDPSAFLDLDLGTSDTNLGTNETQEQIVRNIPPYDPAADTSERAYIFDEIIPKSIRPDLMDIMEHLESGEFSSKGYGNFVSNRVNKLQELQGKDQERLAWILSYIQHLLSLLARNSSMAKRHRKGDQATSGPKIPHSVFRKLLLMFTEQGSSGLSTEKHELLINYILVLTLYADNFRSDPNDICQDLKMTRQMVKPYYDQLGCKSVSSGAFKSSVMTLPAPLKFPKEVTRRKRRR